MTETENEAQNNENTKRGTIGTILKTRNIDRQSLGWMNVLLQALIAARLALLFGTAVALADEPAKSADEIAKELSNPAGSLASLNFKLEYQTFTGDLTTKLCLSGRRCVYQLSQH